jgi:hypothetical protein
MVFTVVSAITFVVTLIPDFTYLSTVDGASNAENRRAGGNARDRRALSRADTLW